MSGGVWLMCSGVWMLTGGDRWCLGGVWGVSGGCLGVSGGVWGVSGGFWWCLGGVGWCLDGVKDTFTNPGTLCPPPCYTGIQDPVPDRVKKKLKLKFKTIFLEPETIPIVFLGRNICQDKFS